MFILSGVVAVVVAFARGISDKAHIMSAGYSDAYSFSCSSVLSRG